MSVKDPDNHWRNRPKKVIKLSNEKISCKFTRSDSNPCIEMFVWNPSDAVKGKKLT